MRRLGSHGLLAAGLIAAAGCGAGEAPPSPKPSPAPVSVRELNPCSLLEPSAAAANGLGQGAQSKESTYRNCWWTADAFATAIFVRWDRDALVDFTTNYPVSLGEVEVGGEKVIMGKTTVTPACTALYLAEQGTVVAIVVGYKRPASVGTACERVKSVGAPVVQHLRALHLGPTK